MPSKPLTHSQRTRRPEHKERSAFYRSASWLSLRAELLSANPICCKCRQRAATDLDHVIARQDRPDLELDRGNLQGLCHECHSKKTVEEMRVRGTGKEIKIYRRELNSAA